MSSKKSNRNRNKGRHRNRKTHTNNANNTSIIPTIPLEEPFFPSCKICLDTSDEELLSPCKCKGTSAYVHSSCLEKWHILEPTKGLTCSVCLHPLAIHYKYPKEVIPTFTHNELVYIYKPYITILFLHCIFVHSYIMIEYNTNYINTEHREHTDNTVSTLSTFQDSYCIYQIAIHLMYLTALYMKLSVKNKLLYLKKWLTLPRISFCMIHIVLINLIPYLYIVGGMIENIYMFLYIIEHTRILEELNSENDFVFTNFIN
jgi:hypothetical protein